MAAPRTLARGLLGLRRYSLSSLPLPTSASEQLVLSSLASLLPTNPNPAPTPNPRASERLLSPEERLRGVFLQKLPGRAALENALSVAAAGDRLSPELFAAVVDRGNLGGAAMVAFSDWAMGRCGKLPPCAETYNVLLRALGRRKFFGFFDEVLQRMRQNGVLPDLRTLEILMDSLVAARQVTKAVQLFKNLDDIGAKCDAQSFTVLLKCLCRRSHVGVASSLFCSMRGKLDFDNAAYNEIIGGWARCGRVDKVEMFWIMMQEEGLDPDGVAYCYLIEAFGRAGRIGDAVDVFEKMGQNGCVSSTMAYNAMICNFVSAGDLEKCTEYYKCMLEKNCHPDINTYHRMIGAFLKVRRVADALEMFDEMVNRGVLPNMGVITSFIEPLCSFGPPHAAMVIYHKSRKAGCGISLKAYKLLLGRLSRFGKSGMVLKIWEEMQEAGYPSDKETYEFIVNGLCNVGKVDAAVSVVEESLHKGFCLGRVVYSKLNIKLLEMNKVETAYNLFRKVKVARTDGNTRSYCRANGWHF